MGTAIRAADKRGADYTCHFPFNDPMGKRGCPNGPGGVNMQPYTHSHRHPTKRSETVQKILRLCVAPIGPIVCEMFSGSRREK